MRYINQRDHLILKFCFKRYLVICNDAEKAIRRITHIVPHNLQFFSVSSTLGFPIPESCIFAATEVQAVDKMAQKIERQIKMTEPHCCNNEDIPALKHLLDLPKKSSHCFVWSPKDPMDTKSHR